MNVNDARRDPRPAPGRSAYVPPHLRNQAPPPPAPAASRGNSNSDTYVSLSENALNCILTEPYE